MKSPKRPGNSLNFQLSGFTVVCPGGSIPFFGTKTSRPAEQGKEAVFAVGCLWIISE
jgi:hypothetical protein